MNPTECVMLTGYLRAHFPSQPVDEYTTEALSELLAPYAAIDCRRAVLNVAERGERWCSPTDIKAEVKRIRARRIESTPIPEPPPELTVREYPAWIAAERKRIADGGDVEPPALPTPDREHQRRALGMIRGAFRSVDEEPA
jgi:hypothetical protein